MLAGTITMAVNAPPQYVAGATGAFAVNDNGCRGTPPDSFLGVVAVPISFGNLTARQIVAFIGPPPPASFAPLLLGDIRLLQARAAGRSPVLAGDRPRSCVLSRTA